MLYVIFGLKFDIQFNKLYKPIKICHVENVVLKKDFNRNTPTAFFMLSTPSFILQP
jgi:hypothetical protein